MLNILVIDDEANIRKSLTLWLKSHGQQVRRRTGFTSSTSLSLICGSGRRAGWNCCRNYSQIPPG